MSEAEIDCAKNVALQNERRIVIQRCVHLTGNQDALGTVG